MAVVENQDHMDAIKERHTTLWIQQHAFLRSAQTLEVFLDRHLSRDLSDFHPTWRPAREIYGIIIFGLVQIIVDLIFDTQSLYEN